MVPKDHVFLLGLGSKCEVEIQDRRNVSARCLGSKGSFAEWES